MSGRTCLTIVLAAGEGTRMRSSRPKVLHEVAGRSLLAHVLRDGGRQTRRSPWWSARRITMFRPKRAFMRRRRRTFVQAERRGTAHAVLAAKSAIAQGADDILVIFGDTPLIRPQTLGKLRAALAGGAAVAVLGFRPADPTGYGRLVTQGGELIAIVEQADATETERAIALCNGGLMAFDGKLALQILERIGNANRKREFYLTDAVDDRAQHETARRSRSKSRRMKCAASTPRRNSRRRRPCMQQRLRQAALEAGVTLVAPETVFLAADTKFGRDVTVEPYVVFGPGVTVEDGAAIRSFSHLAGAHVGKNAIVGPYRAAASRREARRGRPHRQFRRGQGGARSRTAPRPTTWPISATPGSAPAPTSAPAPSSATTTAWPSTAPTSARAPSSARTRRWWRRSRSATAPMSPPAPSSPRTCRPMRWRSAGAGKPLRKAGPSACAALKSQARRRGKQVRQRWPSCCDPDFVTSGHAF